MEGELIDMIIVKGTYSVSGDVFMLTITQFGIRMDGMDEITFFTPDDFDWDEILDRSLKLKIILEQNLSLQETNLFLLSMRMMMVYSTLLKRVKRIQKISVVFKNLN